MRNSIAAPINSLSASGSASFPKADFTLHIRATKPSSRSVNAAQPNTNAGIQLPYLYLTRSIARIGVTIIRDTVSPLGTCLRGDVTECLPVTGRLTFAVGHSDALDQDM